ncbi:unnamed protein product, partial [Nesidiocoris tenuis]
MAWCRRYVLYFDKLAKREKKTSNVERGLRHRTSKKNNNNFTDCTQDAEKNAHANPALVTLMPTTSYYESRFVYDSGGESSCTSLEIQRRICSHGCCRVDKSIPGSRQHARFIGPRGMEATSLPPLRKIEIGEIDLKADR